MDGEVDEPLLIHTVNYPDLTAPVLEDSGGKGQPSGSHKDQITMHVTAQPALPTSHFGENARGVAVYIPKLICKGKVIDAQERG